ncbi:unnamed protein product [Blepharisma stoltei]|uniref:Uncharacterized protein n=1 Tax=Blepharisma stoltei TaxID=1481888 RepID=A0AAU9J2K3_9CILI|nr:unnamed protein product [Blepharisma stoltei]
MESFDDPKYYSHVYSFERTLPKYSRISSPLKPRAPTPPRTFRTLNRRRSSQSPKIRTQSVDCSPTSVYVFPVPYSFSVALSQTQISPKNKKNKPSKREMDLNASSSTFSPMPFRRTKQKSRISARNKSLERHYW